LGAHEIGPVPENKISVVLGDEFEDEETSSNRITGNAAGDQWSPVPLDPVFSGSGRGPKAHELTNESALRKGEGNFHRLIRRKVDFGDILQFLDKAWYFCCGRILSASLYQSAKG
jgi:hypothetical protein